MTPADNAPAPPPKRVDPKVLIVAIVACAVVILVVVWLFRPRDTKPLGTVTCSDGPRPLIDANQFATRYWAYSVKLEASLSEKAKAGLQLDPKQFQALSDAMQQANEFRKWLVNSYNACAVTQSQYAAYGASYQGMDNIARSLDGISKSADPADKARAAALANQYIQLAGTLGRPTAAP